MVEPQSSRLRALLSDPKQVKANQLGKSPGSMVPRCCRAVVRVRTDLCTSLRKSKTPESDETVSVSRGSSVSNRGARRSHGSGRWTSLSRSKVEQERGHTAESVWSSEELERIKGYIRLTSAPTKRRCRRRGQTDGGQRAMGTGRGSPTA